MPNTREKLIELLKECFDAGHNFEESAEHLISNGATLPILCKEYRYYHDGECAMWHYSCTKDDDFCSKGQRKKES